MPIPTHNLNTGDPVIIDTGADYELGVFLIDEQGKGEIFHIEMHTGRYASLTGKQRIARYHLKNGTKIRAYNPRLLLMIHQKYKIKDGMVRVKPKEFTDMQVLFRIAEIEDAEPPKPSWDK